ncbi:MAG: 1-phosphofructokinase [Chloroflexi bacterium]|nr:1-phosphofructokinase [Chloroflexota bacterium]
MIITLTLNPAADKTIVVRDLAVGQLHRVRESHLDPAGKGINVARLVDRLGCPSIAFGFLAGEIGTLINRALLEEGVQNHFLLLPGQTRLNVTIFDEATGAGTSFWDRGPEVDVEHLNSLEHDIQPWLGTCRVLVLAGSLLPGAREDIYAHYIELARARGVQTILDTDGEPLRLGIQARPTLIKPNLAEAERLVGRSLPDVPSVVQAARDILARGVDVVVISMGARGAICAQGERVWHAIPPTVKRRSTVGSGDSLVAGLAVSMDCGQDIVEGLRLGTAAGAATALVPGTALGTPAEITRLLPQVRIEPFA